jgi:hypothetical protein
MGSALRPPGSAAWGSRFFGVHGVAVPEVGLLCVLVARAAYNLVSMAGRALSRDRPARNAASRRPRRAVTGSA